METARAIRVGLAVGLLSVLVAGAAHAGGLPTFTPPPPATSAAWFDWYDALLASRIADVEFARDTTRYVSSSDGDDADDGLTPATAWATIGAAASWVNAAGGETREVLFKRGDAWYETTGISTSKPGVRFADYGDPQDPRPFISGFATRLPAGSGGWTQLPTPNDNVYARPVNDTVYWVPQDGDIDLESPLSRQTLTSGVQATPGSWFYSSFAQTLYVHPRDGDDPDAHLLEACTAESFGFRVDGDGSLVEDLRADGWGLNQRQREAFHSRATGADRVVFRNCVAYYGNSHVMAHYTNGQGGVVTFVDCVGGFTKFNNPTAGETLFNSYAFFGQQETIFHGCTAARGTLPSAEFPVGRRRGRAAFGHSDGGIDVGLIVVKGMTITDHPHGCGGGPTFINLPPAATLDEARCFIVDTIFEGGTGAGNDGAVLFQEGTVALNCRYTLRPDDGTAALQPNRCDGWWINSTVDLDLVEQTGATFGLYNTNATDNKSRLWNSAVYVGNIPAGMEVRIDFDGPSRSPDGTMYNTIFAKLGGAGDLVPNLPDASVNMSANAYWQTSAPAGDAMAVVLTAAPDVDVPPGTSSQLASGSTALPESAALEFDQRDIARVNDTIGPFEALAPGDVDANGIVDVFDLLAVLGIWGPCAGCPEDADGNGAVDVGDLLLVLANWT